jgi:hypothetical protein
MEVRGILRRACDSALGKKRSAKTSIMLWDPFNQSRAPGSRRGLHSVLESSGTADRSRSSVYASARVRGWRRVATSIPVRRACAAGHNGPAHTSTDRAMISGINHRTCEGGAALVVPDRTVPPFLLCCKGNAGIQGYSCLSHASATTQMRLETPERWAPLHGCPFNIPPPPRPPLCTAAFVLFPWQGQQTRVHEQVDMPSLDNESGFSQSKFN